MHTVVTMSTSLVKNNIMSESPKGNAMVTEWEEVQAAQQNPAAFRPLYSRYYEPIFRYVYQRTAEESLAEDITSHVFVKAIQKLHTYTWQGTPFSAWLYRIASNEVAQHFRDAARKPTVSFQDFQLDSILDESIDIDGGDEPLYNGLLAALDGLPEKDMALIQMRFFEQRSFKEMAAIVDMTEANVKMRTYRLLEKLKKDLAPLKGE